MDNNSNENKNWGTLIRQVMRDFGDEVRIGDKVFLEKVKNIAVKHRRNIPSGKMIRAEVHRYTEGASHAYQPREKYFLKVDKGVYRILDDSDPDPDPDPIEKIEKENEECRKVFNNKNLSENLNNEEKYILIKTRNGRQGPFRDALYQKWGGCSVTGYEEKELLIASHIKPWNVSEKEGAFQEQTDIDNGFLLVANLDKVFDRGFITFDNDGKIEISSQLNKGHEKEDKKLGITSNLNLRRPLSEKNKTYLKYHREKIFKHPKRYPA